MTLSAWKRLAADFRQQVRASPPGIGVSIPGETELYESVMADLHKKLRFSGVHAFAIDSDWQDTSFKWHRRHGRGDRVKQIWGFSDEASAVAAAEAFRADGWHTLYETWLEAPAEKWKVHVKGEV